MLDQIWK